MNDQEYIKKRVHELYYGIDMNCARTTLTVLGEVLNVKIEDQTMDAALGLHGAGGFRAQCGLVEGALMFIGIWGRLHGKEEKEIVKACYDYAKQFTVKFGSLSCRELRPGGFQVTDPPHLCETMSANAISFAYKYVTDWIPEKADVINEAVQVEGQKNRLATGYRTKWLKFLHITDRNDFHIHEYHGVSYLYQYVPYKKLQEADPKKQDLIRCFYEFTRGDKRSTQRIFKLYYQYIKKFLWLKNVQPAFTLAVIPSSDPGKDNPLIGVAEMIAKKGRYLNAVTIDGKDLLVRTRALTPVKKGNHHTIQEQMNSMMVTKKPHTETVIILDDIVNSGSSAYACMELLKKEGVKNVYVLCLFSCRK